MYTYVKFNYIPAITGGNLIFLWSIFFTEQYQNDVGFIRLNNIKIYLACEDGYLGTNCAFKCRYPTFGKQCQSLCNCDNQNCDYANGCIQPTKSKILQQ